MGDIYPDIKPNGLSQKDLIDALYMIVSSIKGICAKLDADGGVTDTDYEANCYTALINTIIEDSKGNRTGNTGNHIITPIGIQYSAYHALLYEIFNAIETLTEQLDLDGGVTDATYEALCYTALVLGIVEDGKGNLLGNGTNFYWRPSGGFSQREDVDLLYNFFNSIETLTEQLDADGGVTDTDYEALWFTANCTLKIQNSTGSIVGN